jgi:hypothetical protein
VVVDGMNRIIDDVSTGRQVFYAFYTEEQQRRDPTNGTRDSSSSAASRVRRLRSSHRVAASPDVGSVHEGFPYAAAISDAGYNAFVLKYRAGLGPSTWTQR